MRLHTIREMVGGDLIHNIRINLHTITTRVSLILVYGILLFCFYSILGFLFGSKFRICIYLRCTNYRRKMIVEEDYS